MRKWPFRRNKRNFRIKVFLAFLLIFAIFISIDCRLRPLIKTLAASQADLISTIAINKAVTEELAQQDISYEGIINIQKDKDGQVVSVSTDIVKMNTLKAAITNKVQKLMESFEDRKISVPVGTLTGIDYFSGRGPRIPLKLQLAGSIYTELVSTFDSAGINQTRHRIMLSMSTSIYVIIPGFNTATVVDSNFIIAESIIVGKVPNAYTKISGITNDQYDKINNFLEAND